MTYEEGGVAVEEGTAFINPKAKFSRDATIAYARLGSGLENILDATAATGIRGIRYMKELKPKGVTFLEINPSSYEYLRANLDRNGIDPRYAINTGLQQFANGPTRERFDMIDIDPFGSPAPYIFDSLKISRDNGLLCVTATDTAVLCGAHIHACAKTYDSMPMHNELGHEAGLRILIGFVARAAAQFNYGIKVGFSFSYMHYMRTMLWLSHGAADADSSLKKMGFAYKCNHCGWYGFEAGAFTTILKCPECGSQIEKAGRMWLGSLSEKIDAKKLEKAIADTNGMDGKEASFMLKVASEPDIPFYYSIPKLTKIMNMPSVSELRVVEILKSKGMAASVTYLEKNCVKTNASIAEVRQAIKEIAKR